MKTAEKVAEERRAREGAIKRLLKTKDGELLLEELELTFNGSLIVRDEGRRLDRDATLVNVGAREVIVHLKGIRDRSDA
jgi:hypothetical protein